MGIHRRYSGTLTRAAATVSGSESITGVGGKPVMIIFHAVSDLEPAVCSKGWDDGSISSCTSYNIVTGLINLLGGTSNFSNVLLNNFKAVDVKTTASNGHSANISSMDVDGFTLNWTKIGTGQSITIKYVAIL